MLTRLGVVGQAQGHRGACVTSVAASGHHIVAAEFLTSLTAFKLSADAAVLQLVSVDSGTMHVQALHMLSSSHFLGEYLRHYLADLALCLSHACCGSQHAMDMLGGVHPSACTSMV